MIQIFQRELDGFSSVLPTWTNSTVALLGGGPSLTLDEVLCVGAMKRSDLLRVIAINDSYLIAPWSDVLYAADQDWWAWHSEGIAKPALSLSKEQVRDLFNSFEGERCTVQTTGQMKAADAVHVLRNKHHPVNGNGLSLDPRVIVTGRHGGFQALNIAVLAGAKKIVLLGFDGKPNVDGKTHWSGGHPRPTKPAAYDEYRRSFSLVEHDLIEAGVRVINCSQGSAIDSFEKMRLQEALVA